MTNSAGIFVLLIVVGIVLWIAMVWNRLVAMRARTRAAWASVDALLKRRSDLVPNLVAVVTGAMDFERGTLEAVVTARTEAANATGARERAAAETALAGTVSRLFAVVERYPDLKANQQILALQQELANTESEIASARRYYNAVVRDMNTLQERFPTLLIAGPLGFQKAEYFQADAGERAVPLTTLEQS